MDAIRSMGELYKQAEAATLPLTEDGSFHIFQLWYDGRAFGNIVVLLQPRRDLGFRIMFTKDRDQPFCYLSPDAVEVGRNMYTLKEDWHYIGDVLDALGIPKQEITVQFERMFPLQSFEEMMPRWSFFVKNHIEKLREAYTPESYPRTRELIQQAIQRRNQERF